MNARPPDFHLSLPVDWAQPQRRCREEAVPAASPGTAFHLFLPPARPLLAESEGFRCRCALTEQPCQRRADGEDLNCDWCRRTDHQAWARQNLPVSLGGQADLPR